MIFRVCRSDSLMFTSSPDNGSGGSRKPAGSPRRGGTRSAVPARATRRATLAASS